MGQETIPEFDIDRVVEELDTIFQDQLAKNILQFDKDISKTSDEWRLELQENLSEHKKVAKETAQNMREEILAEIQRGRTTVVVQSDAETVNITVENMDHPVMESVLTSLLTQKKTMLVGPAGTGKSTMTGMIASRLKLPFFY